MELDHVAVESLLDDALTQDISVDLERMIVGSASGKQFTFAMDPFRRECLLVGLDEIALTLTQEPAIAAYEQRMGI